MKNVLNMKRVIVAATVLVGFATSANAQSNATASTTAVLVTPLKVVKTTDMHFGTVAASATAGSIALGYDNTVLASGGAAVIDDALAKTGQFTVTGSANESFSIALTTTTLELATTGGDKLTVSGIECEQGTSTTLVSGTKVLNIKATLAVPADAVAGTYTNADKLEVTVAYN